VTPEELSDFQDVITEVCERNNEIKSVLMTGSLTQRLRLPDPIHEDFDSKYEAAYSLIEKKSRRRIYPSRTSDLDIWVCLKNPEGIEADVEAIIESRGIELIKWLADNVSLYPTDKWAELKMQAFGEFYKQVYMYSAAWNASNPKMPWRGSQLKREIAQAL
jgi:hypothetical protein